MKLWKVEICNLNNEYLQKGLSINKGLKIFFYCIAAIYFILGAGICIRGIGEGDAAFMLGGVLSAAVGLVFCIPIWAYFNRVIAECKEEIEKRSKSGGLSNAECEQHKQDTQNTAVGIGCLVVILVVVILIAVACSSSSSSSGSSYEIGAGGNRKGTQAEYNYKKNHGYYD